MIELNRDTCKACGLCADICPRSILEQVEEEGELRTRVCEERRELCIECGHCMALCATGSLRVGSLDAAAFDKLPRLELPPEQLLALLRRRRTIRRYKDEPVPRAVLDQIAAAAQTAPMPTSHGIHVIVVDQKDKLAELTRMMAALYERLVKMMRNPIMRFMIRRKLDGRTYQTMSEFLLPGLRWYLRWYREGRSDELTRDCAAVMLFHVPRLEPDGDTCCVIAATHAVLMAECLGVGSVYNGVVHHACDRDAELRAFLGVPGDHEVCAALSLGYPRIRFKKSIPRNNPEVCYLD